MKSLSEALKNINHTAEPLTKSKDLLNMQVHGSITEAGKMNTTLPNSQSQNQSTSEQRKLSDCPQSQSRLTSLLLICFDTLDTFGKEPEQLANLAESFRFILGRFTIEQVESAFRAYMESSTSMPKPADIVKIIEPPVEPRKWCGATFIDIKRRKREGQFITLDEEKYCYDFLQARIKEPDSAGMIDDTIKQVERENKQYWIE